MNNKQAALVNIADRARVLAITGPENAKNRRTASEGIAMRRDGDFGILRERFLEHDKHAARNFEQERQEILRLVRQLTELVYQHLPEVDIVNLDCISPDCDWKPIVQELQRIKNAAKRKASAWNGIPPDKRLGPMTKLKAAKLLGKKGNPKRAVEWLNACVDDGTIRCEQMSRQSFYFHQDDFPPTN